MRNKSWKWVLLGAALSIVVLYGIEISTAGIERIYGPLEQEQLPPTSVVPSEQQLPADTMPELTETERRIVELEKEIEKLKIMTQTEQKTVIEPIAEEREYVQQEEQLIMELEPNEATVNKLADSASGMLQSASNSSIKFIVSIFEGFIK
ncbi:hypothetical protein ACFSTH_05295 [Paenibacillus yanchengensis]|uniref:Uncharacterized protein n=1 Tax=Paenibacillus yanchengensis TaxID=2035833 RepID=A0ABW4YKQ2_9BACL